MAKSKFFRAFVEGNTISDGRKITAEMIDDSVATFNAETYSPRINVEHIAGFSPEPPFNGYGTVLAVKAQDDEFTIAGKTETRRALYMQVDGNKQLVKLATDDQKPFPSVELTDDYAGTGKFGLVGLAFTDNPASIGTQKLQFSRSAPGTNFAIGAEATQLEFEQDEVVDNIGDRIGAAIAKAFSAIAPKKEEPKPEAKADVTFDPAAFSQATQAAMTGALTAFAQSMDAKLGPIAQLRTDLDALKGQLESEPGTNFTRKPASGVAAAHLTDC